MPFDANCGGCFHHGESIEGAGQCRALPPDQPRTVPPPSIITGIIPLTTMAYRWTEDTEPACGLYRPKVEPEAPPVETKAERIARLTREGVTDLAAFKRVLDGR